MIEEVRAATAADWPGFAELQDDARRSLALQRGGAAWLADHPSWTTDGFAEFLGRRARAAVAVIDGTSFGHALTSLDGSGRRAVVEWLYVDPGGRELGLGEMLLADAIEWATTAGADVIESVALPGDRETKNMFERFGMKARMLTVSKPLGATTDEPVDAGEDATDALGG